MRLRDLIYETFSALDSNRGRSALTILGIVIGISAVIAMTSLIDGVKMGLVNELGFSQARLIQIEVYGSKHLTLNDVEKLEKNLPNYEFITAVAMTSAETTGGTNSSENESTYSSIMGVEPQFFEAMGMKLAQGSLFGEDENKAAAMVCLIDESGVRTLFGNPDEQVVGNTINLAKQAYTIVGVLQSQRALGGNVVQVYVPHTTAVRRFRWVEEASTVMGFAREGVDIDALVEQTRNYIISYYQIPEDEQEMVYITSMKSITDQLNATMLSFQVLMTTVAGISLVVGGIGIMNMMLTNVTERIREIGLRKALGARSSDITRQFLLESVLLCIAGGVIGIILGFLAAFALSGVASGLADGINIVPVVSPSAVILATSICVGIGVVFGYWPARRAAKLDPVESLHYQ